MLQSSSAETRISRITAISIILICAFFLLKNPPSMIISWDVFGYYLYLPAFFLHHDVGMKDFAFVQHLLDTYHPTGSFYQAAQAPSGFWVNKYSMGMAVLYLPSFAVGHIFAKILGFPADGLSAPYQYALIVGSFIYSILGILFLRKILLKFFSDGISAAVLILIVLGTNYFQNAVYSGAMPHNYLFTLYAILIWLTIRWHEEQNIKHIILIGLLCGLATLSRPSELISILIPLLWGIKDKQTFLDKLKLLRDNWLHVFIAAAAACIICSPQLLYWHTTMGKWLYNSYNNPGEGFEFLHPYTWKVLFSFRKGWLIYTPIMIFAIAGFYFMKKKNSPVFYTAIIFSCINLYIISSWSCWWYADSFSQRALVQSYPLLAFPLGYLLLWISDQKRVVNYLAVAMFSCLIALNLFQTWQVFHGIIHSSRMTRGYYFSVLGKTKVTEDDLKKLMVTRAYTGTEVFNNEAEYTRTSRDVMDFEESQSEIWSSRLDTAVAHSGNYSFRLDSTGIYSPNFFKRYSVITDKDHAWIRLSAWVYPVKPVTENPFTIIASFRHKGWDYKYNGLNLLQQQIVPNQWNRIQMDYLTPEVRNVSDSLMSYFWLQGKATVYIDDFKLEVFEKK